MRQIVLAAILTLALAPAALAKPPTKCFDAAGKPAACPDPSKGEVKVTAPPLRKPDQALAPIQNRPDLAIPPMATALCMDGTYSKSPQPTSACSIHGGVSQWVH